MCLRTTSTEMLVEDQICSSLQRFLNTTLNCFCRPIPCHLLLLKFSSHPSQQNARAQTLTFNTYHIDEIELPLNGCQQICGLVLLTNFRCSNVLLLSLLPNHVN